MVLATIAPAATATRLSRFLAIEAHGQHIPGTPTRPVFVELLGHVQAALSDRYLVSRELGTGGMAVVYRATDLRHHRPVAIKVLLPAVASAMGPARFLREIEILSRLGHPHILPLLDSGTATVAGSSGHPVEVPYYVMPLVEGESLREVLGRRTLPPEVALGWAREIADALAYAHEQGILHRDIKPGNILIQGGHAVVADFGIARAVGLASNESLTTSGVAVGTPQYMSPEQATGATVGPETDTYALGCVLFEMLTGRPPYSGPAVLGLHATAPIPSVRRSRPEIPAKVDLVIRKALAKRPEDRFRTAAEFREVIGGLGLAKRRLSGRAIGLATVVVAAATVAIVRFRPERTAGPLDATLLAVAPFEVPAGDADLAVWHEGMVDLLSRSFDGAGSLRAVAPTVVVRRWAGRADRASGVALGRRTGAGLVLVGQLLPTGTDSLRLTAQLVDAAVDRIVSEHDFRAPKVQADRLADSLAVAVLRSIPGQGDAGLRTERSRQAPLPALKAFLNGERLLRLAAWDSALGQFRVAIELDSAFAFAWYRAGLVLGWQRTDWDTLASAYRRQAGRLNHGLAPRDSILVWADSMSGAIYQAGGSEYPLVRRLLRDLAAATQRWPDDPELWRMRGEEAFHHGLDFGVPRAEVLAAFDRSIELDSAHAPSYVHAITLAHAVRGRAVGARYLSEFLRRAPAGFQVEGIRLAADLMAAADPAAPELVERLRLLKPPGLFEGWAAALWAADSGMAAVRLARELAGREVDDPPTLSNRGFRRGLIETALGLRGRIREATAVAGPGSGLELAEIGIAPPVPDEVVAGHLRRSLAAGDLGDLAALTWWAAHRDSAALQAVVRRCQSGRQAFCRGALAGSVASGYLTLLRGDTAGAVAAFRTLPDTLCRQCGAYRLTAARLLIAGGRDREAADYLKREVAGLRSAGGVLEVYWALLRAEVAEHQADSAAAKGGYRFVLDQWRWADPALAGLVERARRGLARIGDDR